MRKYVTKSSGAAGWPPRAEAPDEILGEASGTLVVVDVMWMEFGRSDLCFFTGDESLFVKVKVLLLALDFFDSVDMSTLGCVTSWTAEVSKVSLEVRQGLEEVLVGLSGVNAPRSCLMKSAFTRSVSVRIF